MIKVFLILIVVPLGASEPVVRRGEVENVKQCLELVTEFMSHTPAELKLQGMSAGCQIIQNNDPS